MTQFPNPSTQFKKGQSGNPGGFTPEQVEQRKANRDRAFDLESKMLDALHKDMTDNDAAILDHIRSDVLKLIHTAIERIDGKATQPIDNTSSDGSMSPVAIKLVPYSAPDEKDG